MPTPTTAQAAPSVDRPLRSPTEHTTAVMQDVSGCLNQLAELYRQLWSVAVANAEAQLTIAIDVQTAALNPVLAVFDDRH